MNVRVEKDESFESGQVTIFFDNQKVIKVLYENIRKGKGNYLRYWEIDGPVDGDIEYSAKEVEG